MKPQEFKELIQYSLKGSGFTFVKVLGVEESSLGMIVEFEDPLSYNQSDDMLLIGWFESRFSNGTKIDEINPHKLIVFKITENSRDLYPKKEAAHSILTPVESSKMKGTPGHCICAQIFDSEGMSMATISTHYGAEKASKIAKEVELAINCTYGANIDPEGIQELINVVDLIYSKAPIQPLQSAIGIETFNRLFKALLNIKLNKENQ